ncbi:DUF2231 domain-containing protein [Micromonospora sp. NPDC047074]|uniref:DUF2231 domain-containing protein n=1 Tax=Micromonospora sp. NPDC047074 TaxID=3154339 RepID=UPI0033EDFC56
MQSRLRVQGHPIQPMLVTFPFGLFVSATVFDLTDVLGGPAFLGEVGYWTAVAALFAAALAAVAGMIDLWDVPGDRTQRTAITFNLLNVGMAALFLVTCLVRAESPQRGATVVLLLIELVALGVGAAGVRLGARLVRRFDAGRRAEATTFDALADVPTTTTDLASPRP